ncbi:unnamed protein product [Spodoptera exigua]|nr:unnamed protein product [Spodoptera exigua]
MAAPASASARPHQRETDEQRKREKRERAAPRASGLAGDRARPLAVVGSWCEGSALYRARGVARAASSIAGSGGVLILPRTNFARRANFKRHLTGRAPNPTHDQPVDSSSPREHATCLDNTLEINLYPSAEKIAALTSPDLQLFYLLSNTLFE